LLCLLWFKSKWTQNWLLTVFKYSTTLQFGASWIYIARRCRFPRILLFEMLICLNNSKYKFATRTFCDFSWLGLFIIPIFLLKFLGDKFARGKTIYKHQILEFSKYSAKFHDRTIKGSLTRVFSTSGFFMNQFPPGTWVYHEGHCEFWRKFTDIFESKG
jgi:hypothetical protein